MRTAAKKDNSHKAIEIGLKQLGISYLDASQLKHAFDFIVFYRGNSYFFEAKSREYASKANQLPEGRIGLLTDGEKQCRHLMNGAGVGYHIVFDIDEVLTIIGAKTAVRPL